MSNALITVATIAAAAAITAGLLVLAGVGDEDSRSRREAQAREERIDNYTQNLATDIIREYSSLACDAIDQPGAVGGEPVFSLLIQGLPDDGSEDSQNDRLSEAELREVSGRLDDEIKSQCRELGR